MNLNVRHVVMRRAQISVNRASSRSNDSLAIQIVRVIAKLRRSANQIGRRNDLLGLRIIVHFDVKLFGEESIRLSASIDYRFVERDQSFVVGVDMQDLRAEIGAKFIVQFHHCIALVQFRNENSLVVLNSLAVGVHNALVSSSRVLSRRRGKARDSG